MLKRLIWMGCFSYLLIGFAHVVAGSVLRMMLEHYDLSYDQGGVLIFIQFAGFMIGVLTTPWWSRIISRRGALLLALTCLTLAESVFSTLPSWNLVLGVAPIAGFGFGMIEAVIGSLMIDAAAKNEKAAAFSRLEVFFGLGALIMPLISVALISIGWWRLSFAAVAVFAFVMAILWKWVPMGGDLEAILRNKARVPQTAGVSLPKLNASALGVLSAFVVVFIIYVGVEMSLVNFLPSIMVEAVQIDEAAASLSVTFFWVAMTIGRLFTGKIAEWMKHTNYLLFHTFLAVLIMALLMFAGDTWQLFTLVLLLGLAMSGMFAVALIHANAMLPGRTERITSVLIASGGIGGAILPLLTGWSLTNFTVQSTIMVLAGMMMLMLILLTYVTNKRVAAAIITGIEGE